MKVKKRKIYNLYVDRKKTKINIYKVAKFKNIPKPNKKYVYSRLYNKSIEKSLRHERKINILKEKIAKNRIKQNNNQLFHGKVKSITKPIEKFSIKVLENNEDKNTATEGFGKVTYNSSRTLTSNIRREGKKIGNKIRKQSNKITKIQKKEVKNIFLRERLYRDKSFNQMNVFSRYVYKNFYYTRHRILERLNSLKNFIIELPTKILNYLIHLSLSFLSFLMSIIPFLPVIIIFIIIIGMSGNNKPLSLLHADDIVFPAEGKITDRFGWREGFYLQDGSYYPRNFHSGIDIANVVGTPIYAFSDGEVTTTDTSLTSGYGNLIEIKHNDVISTRYAHLSKINVVQGQNVKKGELIGLMGSTGYSTGSHLHFEIRKYGEAIDPEIYIQNILNSVGSQELPKEVLRWEEKITEELKKYNLETYKDTALIIIMLESGGRSEELPDIMQSSESIGLSPNEITSPDTSIRYGIKHLKTCIERMNKYNVDYKTMIHSYNYGLGFIEYVSRNGGQWTQELANKYSDMQANRLGWNAYGDKNYVNKFMEYLR